MLINVVRTVYYTYELILEIFNAFIVFYVKFRKLRTQITVLNFVLCLGVHGVEANINA